MLKAINRQLKSQHRSWFDQLLERKEKQVHTPFQSLKRPAPEAKDLDQVVTNKINVELILQHWDCIVRIAASVKSWMTVPSMLPRKLGSYSRKSSLIRAFQEVGRIAKTIFILDYLNDIDYRRRVQTGINKLNDVHKIGGPFFYGRQGEVRVAGYEQQLQRASCLNLLIMAALVWNSLQITNIVERLRHEGKKIRQEDLGHVSPLAYEHIIQYGEYRFDIPKAEQAAAELKAIMN